MNSTRILYTAANPPAVFQSARGACRVCGAEDVPGIPFDTWVRDTFTNHDQLRPGDIICEVCQFSFAQGSEFLAVRVGKDKPQRMQNYSHIVLRGVWHPLHKGQKAEILDLLRQSPEVVAIGTSGQKHIVFRARPGWWQIEEQCVRPDLHALDTCLDLVGKLYRIFSKEEIGTGQYSPGRTMQYAQAYGLDDYLAVETALRQWRGTAYFDLALYLAQKASDDEQTGSGLERLSGTVPTSTDIADPTVAGAGTSVQTEICAQHLGAVRGEHSRGGLHQQREQVLQRSLFETGDRADSA